VYQKDNQDKLSIQMLLVEKKMDEEERRFRKDQATRPLSECFGRGFDHLVQRLWTDLKNPDRLVLAQTHAQMIRETLKMLHLELTKRGFGPEAHSLKIVFKGLDLLEQIMLRESPSESTQDEFDLIYDGFKKKLSEIRGTIATLDEKFRTPLS